MPKIASLAPDNVVDDKPPREGTLFVHAGTHFAVRLDAPIDNLLSPLGQKLVARNLTTLLSNDGAVAVPMGAKLRGRLDAADVRAPFLWIELDLLDTVAGPTNLVASIQWAELVERKDLVRFPLAPVAEPDGPRFIDYFRMPVDTRYMTPGVHPYDPGYITEISLPKGAVLDLVLMRPLVLPRPHPETNG